MRIGLDDNTRDALHFVLLGSGVLLLLRLIVAGIGLLLEAPFESDLTESIAGFRNGYLLSDPGILVSGGMELPGRLAAAVILSVVAGIVGAILFSLVARISRGDARRAAVQGARAGSILMLVWALYAAFFLPPLSARVDEGGITVTERVSLSDGISWPWPASGTMIPWKEISSVEHRSAVRSVPCWSHENVVITTREGEHVIASITPQGAECQAAQNEAAARSKHLEGLLNAYRLR